ncbi:hypothetical protein U9M48_019872 [Paspalum notatum var. saurae]|uniref:Uncharacterized protein n=1 Tax=Paspalum notatum var. saurae TaxID=547442 RepID=A0AAQ3TC70_PASNO
MRILPLPERPRGGRRGSRRGSAATVDTTPRCTTRCRSCSVDVVVEEPGASLAQWEQGSTGKDQVNRTSDKCLPSVRGQREGYKDPFFGLTMGFGSQSSDDVFRWFCVEAGSSSNPKVLLIHGLPSQINSQFCRGRQHDGREGRAAAGQGGIAATGGTRGGGRRGRP